MRNATLSGVSDLGSVRPGRTTPAGRNKAARAPSKPRLARTLFGRFRSHAVVLVATSGFAAIMAGIVLNATLFQKGHHPAPLFGSVGRGSAPVIGQKAPHRLQAMVAPSAPPPPPPAAAVPAEIQQEAPPAPVSRPAHMRAAVPARAAIPGRSVDRIAQLLAKEGPGHSGTAAPAHAPAAHAAPPRAGKAQAELRPARHEKPGTTRQARSPGHAGPAVGLANARTAASRAGSAAD